jgi:hypothetical protein
MFAVRRRQTAAHDPYPVLANQLSSPKSDMRFLGKNFVEPRSVSCRRFVFGVSVAKGEPQWLG